MSPQKKEFLKDYIKDNYDLLSDVETTSNMNHCCGIRELGEFEEDSQLEESKLDLVHINQEWKEQGKTKRSDITTEEFDEVMQELLLDRVIELLTEDKYPKIITLLTEDQSKVLAAFETADTNSEIKGSMTFQELRSGSTGNDLTIIIYDPS